LPAQHILPLQQASSQQLPSVQTFWLLVQQTTSAPAETGQARTTRLAFPHFLQLFTHLLNALPPPRLIPHSA